MTEPATGGHPDPLRFDVGLLVSRTVASLYASLVTRPTGRAVRIAIESQLAEVEGPHTVSIIDLSRVSLLDFSCADEVVAKLMARREAGGLSPDGEAPYFILHGFGESHRGPIEAVLERHRLAIVARTEPGDVELLGAVTAEERRAWVLVQDRGHVVHSAEAGEHDRALAPLPDLVRRGLVYFDSAGGSYHALSWIAGDAPGDIAEE